MSKSKIACVDFDGTCVMHEYPQIGDDVPNAINVLKKLNENHVKLILWTIRSENICRMRSIGLLKEILRFGRLTRIRNKDSGRNLQRLLLLFILTMLRLAAL